MEKEVAAGISGHPQAKRSRRDDHKYKARLSGGEHTWTFSRGHVTLQETQGERACDTRQKGAQRVNCCCCCCCRCAN